MFTLMTTIVGTFVCVKFHEKLPLPYIVTFASSAVSCLAYDVCTYPPLGDVYSRSKEYLRGGGDRSQSKEWRLAKKSMAVLSVHVRDNFIMDRDTLLTVFSLVINYTTNLFVSF